MNFQLRFSPNVLALRDLIGRGLLGDIVDIEVRLVVKQPWHLWTFLERAPRLEILYHSIHYLDTIRAIAGEPRGVYCRAVAHPSIPEFQDTRSSIILDYGKRLRCSLLLNHTHQQDTLHRASFLKVEGTRGAAQLTMGVNIDYPNGPPDTLEVALEPGSMAAASICVARGSSKRSRGRCRTCSGMSPAKTLRSCLPSKTPSRRWRSSRRAICRAPAGGTPVPEV